MKITCSGCGRTLNVPEKALGKTVRCPACKTTVKVEETFSVMPDGPPAYESEIRPEPDIPAALPAAQTCPTCGFLLLPDADHCSRCGTDLATGQRRRELVGYQASFKTKLFSRTGWIVTLAVTGVIVAVIVLVVLRVRSYAEKVATHRQGEEKAAGALRDRVEGVKPSSTRARSRPAAKALEKSKPKTPAAPPKEDIAATFDSAFNFLVNTSPSAQREGLVRITQMGAKAVPLVEKRLAECGGSDEGEVRARQMLARALGRIKVPESSALLLKLHGLLADADARVRAEALDGLTAHGTVAQDALTIGLGSESASMRAAAARAAKRLQFPEHTMVLLALLTDDDPAVSVRAAEALSATPGTPDIYAALVSLCSATTLDVGAAASAALVKQKGAFDQVLKALTGREATGEVLREPRTFFLAAPLVAWKAPMGLKMLATYLGGGRSSPEILTLLKKFLDARNPINRVEALKTARFERVQESQAVFAALLCLTDTNSFVAGSALRYISSLDELRYPLPLVVMLGGEDIEFAILLAAELARRKDEATADVLKGALGSSPLKRDMERDLDGARLQRRIMAAGVLARREDDRGPVGADVAALLRDVSLGVGRAAGWEALPPPLSGWAAYHCSFLGSHGVIGTHLDESRTGAVDLGTAFAEKAKNSPSNLDRAYYAAAAAKLGSSEMLANLRGQLGARSRGFHARIVVRLLGELHGELKSAGFAAEAKDALVYQLHQNDPELLTAVVESLRALGDASVVGAVIERIPRVKPEAAFALRETVSSFGREAEPHVLKMLQHDSPLVRRAAMDCLTDFGTRASKDVIRRLVEILQETNIKRDLRTGVPKVLAVVLGLGEKPDWNWRDWAKAARVHVKDLSERLEYKRLTRQWLSIDVPKAWKMYAGRASDLKADGNPEIRVKVFRDRPGTPRSRRRYRSERDFRSKRKVELALVSTARGGKIKPGLKVEDAGSDYAGKAKVTGMRLIDEKQARTSYYLFLFARVGKDHFYAEMIFSAETRCYGMYRTLFEERIAKSIKVDL